MSVTAVHNPPRTEIVYYGGYGLLCYVCGYEVERYFHRRLRGVVEVWAEHRSRSFGLYKRDCLIRREASS